MNKSLKYQKITSITAVILLALFCVFVIFYEQYSCKEARSQIQKHGQIIADALWNSNPQGSSEYLSLACKSQNYRQIIVTDTRGNLFQSAMGDASDWREHVFKFFHLIHDVRLISAVTHDGKPIGFIEAIWACDTIYLEGLVLIALVMTYVIFLLTFRLLLAKRVLEGRVLERTCELSTLNASLQLEVEEHRRARRALFKSEERYRLIAENVADVIWVFDMDFVLTYVSPSVYQQRGYTIEEIMSKFLEELIPPDGREILMMRYGEKLRLIQAGDPEGWEPAMVEIEQYCKDGSVIWTSNNARVIKGPGNQPEGVLGVTRDITRQKRAEKEKLKAQRHAGEQEKQALVGQIAGKMAHDFNNILGVIMGNTELSLLDCKDGDIKKTLELIYGQTLRGKNLTRNLVAFAKDQEPKQEFFSIAQKIDLVLSLLKKDLEGIELVKEDGPGVPDLLADPGMIEHALVNLIQNSIHALGLAKHPRIIIRTYCSDGNICLEIEDNGCGIPKEYLGNIYEPAFTLKGSQDVTGSYKPHIKGTGYGMANIKKNIKQHKGCISVDSEFGSGAKFIIRLPVIEKELTREEKIEIIKSNPQVEKQILHVEDERSISDVHYRVLTRAPCNHKVDRAYSGQEAIALFDGNEYDFVSLDYILPGEFNGMDVYHHIRKTNTSVPILFVSGNIEFLESIKELKQKDALIDHLSKPCQNKEYVNRINGLLEKGRTLHQRL
jgi:PAS domain S-box-containing protein